MVAFNPNDLPFYDPKTERKVCFITGGNSGIGYYTVLHLYLHGYTVYMAGRSETRMNEAITNIKSEAIIRKSKIPELKDAKFGDLRFIYLDLLDLSTVESAVKEFESKELKLDLLINNAGIMAVPFALTKDNFEIQLQTNYVAHFLLTDRLVRFMDYDTFRNTADIPRIVTLTSFAHFGVFYPFSLNSSFKDYKPHILFTSFRYALAKTASLQFSRQLSIRYPHILSVSLHPGVMVNTNLFSPITRLPFIGAFCWIVVQIVGYFFGVTNEEGAYATLRCGVSDDISLKDNGKYFFTYGRESVPSRISRNQNYAEQNWAWTVMELSKRGFKLQN